MPYIVEPEPGEQIVLDVDYKRKSQSESLRFVVTDRALLVPAKKFTIAGDPYYLKRIPLREANVLRVQAIRPYVAYIFSVIMICVGLITLRSFLGVDAVMTPKGLGYALAIVVGGVLLPLAAKGKHRLILLTARGKFQWVPPSHVDSGSKRQVDEIFTKIVDACELVHIPVLDDRRAA